MNIKQSPILEYNQQQYLKTKNQTIAVVGLGYVGLPLALLANNKGYQVTGIDINEEKVSLLQKNIIPFKDAALEEQIGRSSLKTTTNFSLVKDADIIIICVPTPVYENHLPNLEPVEGACREIAKFLQKGQLVILESTVNPGVCESIVLPILEKGSGLRCGVDFYLAHCPERINPGDSKWNVENINRVVGGFDKTSLEKAVDFYQSIIKAEIKPMNYLKEAEAVKVVENTFRDVNIAFVNELAMSFSLLDINVVNVIEGCATKPFSFMAHYPGCGVGGHCIPVDPYYLINYAKDQGFNHNFLSLARQINNGMPKFTAHLVKKALNEAKINIKDERVAVLGLAYKSNVDDCRESPSFDIIEELKIMGAEVVSFDPFVKNKSDAKSLKEALENTKAVVIATCHDVFKKITPNQLKKYNVEVVIDGRNCLQKEKFIKAGIIYKGIGM